MYNKTHRHCFQLRVNDSIIDFINILRVSSSKHVFISEVHTVRLLIPTIEINYTIHYILKTYKQSVDFYAFAYFFPLHIF